MHLPPLKGIVAFEVVARLGSVNKAADELNVTASAVSHQIANLEGFVGRRLFERTSRGLMLTSVGERYRRDVTGALALIAGAAHNARSSEGVEVLRVHCAPSFASLWLMPRLRAFLAAHPDLRIQLSAAFSDSDFSRGEVDLDIRYGVVRGGDLHVETIFREEILPLASPELLKGVAIREPSDLLAQPLILSAVNGVQWPRWFAANSVPLSPGTYALTFDRTSMALDAAVQGLGIALDSSRLRARASHRVPEAARQMEEGRAVCRLGSHRARARPNEAAVAAYVAVRLLLMLPTNRGQSDQALVDSSKASGAT